MYEPIIKWTGSKRSQAKEILSHFPNQINVYYEPFCGSCAMLRRLLDSDIRVNGYICSDINGDLISLWNMIKNNPQLIYEAYSTMWRELNADSDIERKKQYFYTVRERFNRQKNPADFMFIMRTTTNGMPRYNSGGDFNNSFHITRNGVIPGTLKKILYEWNRLLNENNVQFVHCSYGDIKPDENDFVYLDPPYANTRGMYYGKIDCISLWGWLENLKCKYVLSFDGISGNTDNTFAVPESIYKEHKYIRSGNSSFKRTVGKSSDSIVYESLYLS